MNMLGNWQTINTCVLTSSWHIRTEAQFAGTCIGVFLIVFLIETVRRWSREFDRWILERAMVQRREARRRTQQLKTEMASRLADADPLQDRSTMKQKLEQLDSIFFGIPQDRSGCRQAALDSMRFRPQMWQQLLRSLLYGVQFTGAVSTF
jgi:copper transporter 1